MFTQPLAGGGISLTDGEGCWLTAAAATVLVGTALTVAATTAIVTAVQRLVLPSIATAPQLTVVRMRAIIVVLHSSHRFGSTLG